MRKKKILISRDKSSKWGFYLEIFNNIILGTIDVLETTLLRLAAHEVRVAATAIIISSDLSVSENKGTQQSVTDTE